MTTVGELAERIGAELVGEPDLEIRGAATIDTAGEGDVSFLASRRYLRHVDSTRATALIVAREFENLQVPEGTALLKVDNAHLALARALELLYPEEPMEPGIAPTARLGAGVKVGRGVSLGHYTVVGAGVELGDGVRIGEQCSIGEGASIGPGSVLANQVSVYAGARIGARCIIHSGARIGVDGFGYVLEDGRHRKVRQVGGCAIEDDVEIGANTCIDRGSVGETRIGAGSKIDNLVHIAHNVRIGRHCVIVAQVGIAGSTTLGDGVALAGQVGIIGHLKIGAGAQVGAQSGVSHDIPAGETWFGYPARRYGEAMRASAAALKLPDVIRRVNRLARRLEEPDE